jgi:hypothetical protein
MLDLAKEWLSEYEVQQARLKRIVLYSGGVGSWCAAKRVAERYGTDNLILLFTDTRVEHQDTYRFLRESAANVGGELVEIADGRTIWEVFRDVKFLGNSRVDPCSKILKRQLADRWIKEQFSPEEVVMYVGIDWSEINRYDRMKERKLPYVYEAPLCDPPYLTKNQMHEWAEREGLRKQELYVLGAPHANCGGGCIKMGQGGFLRLLRSDPATFRQWEENEEKLRHQLGNVSILKKMENRVTRPFTLRELRERAEAGGQIDIYDIGGCGCFLDEEEELPLTTM